MKRIVLVANKTWEAAPLMSVLMESRATPPGFPWPTQLWPFPKPLGQNDNPSSVHPRAVFEIDGCSVEVWCIQDYLQPKVGSSSEAKIKLLSEFFSWFGDGATVQKQPDCVIGFGTAAAVGSFNVAGSVYVGGQCFLHNAYPNGSNPLSQWDDPRMNEVLSTDSASVFKALTDSFRGSAESRFLSAPLAPATPPVIMIGPSYMAVSDVNVTDYNDYYWADPEAIRAFQKVDSKNPIGSVETTHGLIRLQSEATFIFVSGIANRVGYLDREVTPRNYAQNYVAAHNAGITLAWMLTELASLISST